MTDPLTRRGHPRSVLSRGSRFGGGPRREEHSEEEKWRSTWKSSTNCSAEES